MWRQSKQCETLPTVSFSVLGVGSTLAIGNVVRKDARGALDGLRRAIETLERYPGLCRFQMG